MFSALEQRIADFARQNNLFGSACPQPRRRQRRILLAVSGGVDSTALIHVMVRLRDAGLLNAELLCAHINHQLRDRHADEDERFVVDLAATLNIEVVTTRIDVRCFARQHRLSVETAARQLRLDSLLRIAQDKDCELIATGHQKDDNAETLIQRLTRGTGFRGLAGIRPVRDLADGLKLARPLLCVTRLEILDYLQLQKIQWRTDHTNEDCAYRRNFIRHRLLPALQQESSDDLVERLFVLSQAARRFDEMIAAKTNELWASTTEHARSKIILDVELLRNQPRPIQIELIRRSLTAIGSGERDLTERHYLRVLQLTQPSATCRQVELPGRFVVLRSHTTLEFAKAPRTSRSQIQVTETVELKVPGQTRFGQYLIDAEIVPAQSPDESRSAGKFNWTERLDLDKINLPLMVRLRQRGNRFVPLGMHAEKRLGKFLTAARVPYEVRDSIVIVADREKIVWVCPVRIGELVKLTSQTQRILRLTITLSPAGSDGVQDEDVISLV
jgi:tRNA(Ile)-lysidine synthase